MRRIAAALLCLTCLASCAPPRPRGKEDISYPVGDFSLTDQDGGEVRAADLRGKVWVASFIFTRCSGPCPHVSATMEGLQTAFAGESDVRLVTFTVDPEHDTPDVLKRYAERFHADSARWLFLTGTEAEVYRLLHDGFKVGAARNTDADATAGNAVIHSTRLAVVDRQGRIRGYFSGAANEDSENPEKDYEENLADLRREVARLLRDGGPTEFFPPLDAALNAAAGLLLLLGYAAVRRGRYRLHAACMLSALAVSAVFLASYLYFHIIVMGLKSTKFADQWPDAPAWVALVYGVVLISHTILAALTAPLALVTAGLALGRRFAWHRRVARWTLPIWLYVSATGVVVYWMLYRLH